MFGFSKWTEKRKPQKEHAKQPDNMYASDVKALVQPLALPPRFHGSLFYSWMRDYLNGPSENFNENIHFLPCHQTVKLSNVWTKILIIIFPYHTLRTPLTHTHATARSPFAENRLNKLRTLQNHISFTINLFLTLLSTVGLATLDGIQNSNLAQFSDALGNFSWSLFSSIHIHFDRSYDASTAWHPLQFFFCRYHSMAG